ncbi:MAG: anthranilate phosphoribosyltransferase [Oligosphaeraceae bacterium]
MLKDLLKKVVAGETLSEQESFSMMEGISQGESLEAAAGLLSVMSSRGEAVEEFTGCTRFLRENMTPVRFAGRCADIVGTGGDGGRSFNISTTAALVAAGAGITMAKHGNRAVSSRCGAADVLEMAGVPVEASPEALERSLAENGIAFLFARTLHPVMAKVAPLRKALGIRTVFNLVGPLANPARAQNMVVGVCRDSLLTPFAEVLRNLGVENAMIVHSEDGLDEFSSLARNQVALLRKGEITRFVVDPEKLLPAELRTGTLEGGDPVENLRILRTILSGEDRTARRGAVLLNAAAVCLVSGLAGSLEEGIPLAERSIDGGAALEKLGRLAQ